MADVPPKTNRAALVVARNVALIVAGWLVASYAHRHWEPYAEHDWIHDAINRVFAGFPSLATFAARIWESWNEMFGASAFVALLLASALFPLGFAARIVARARIRAGHADPLDRLRAWASAWPKMTRALLAAAPVVLWMQELVAIYRWDRPTLLSFTVLGCVPVALVAAVSATLGRRWLAAFLAPTLTGDEAKTEFQIGADEIVFNAVAVTRETKAAVAAVAGLAIAVVAWIATRNILVLYHTLAPLYVIGGYVGVAGASAFVFQRASRVAVGVDGVHVRGTSRAKFYAYRGLDEARTNGGDIELVRRGRVLVRLQLHGEDAARRDAVLARITENVARVKEGRGAAAAQMVASSSKEALARVAHGGADYRMAAMTREQLWALVEGPEIEASARKAAATALATSSDGDERARLRVAASLCAEPHVRVALEEIARGDELANDAPHARRAAT